MAGDPLQLEALFERRRGTFRPTLYTQGPWDPGAQFGGAPSALLATLVEGVGTLTPMRIARLTVDLLRPAPLAPLSPVVQVVRQGKRIQIVAASLFAGGTEVARASALRIRTADLGDAPLPTGEASVPLPAEPRDVEEEPFPGPVPARPGSRRAVEYLFEGQGGYFRDPAWVRLRVPVVLGHPSLPVARLAYTADLANGIGQPRALPVRGINADVALNVLRYPEGEWLSLAGRSWIGRTGIGQVQATISDTRGVVATVSMTRIVDPLGVRPG
ncbi:MAG TPA: thioesterase family protein [Acidimicrobiales bacterium]|nr:thioesterase family protein [Acidimicrobiales bacterium]